MIDIALQNIEVYAPPSVVYAVLTDFASYPKFVPHVLEIEVQKSELNHFVVHMELDLIRQFATTITLDGEPFSQLSWQSAASYPLLHNSGTWRILPEGNVTRLEFKLALGVQGIMPPNIAKLLLEKALPNNLRAFKEESERRASQAC